MPDETLDRKRDQRFTTSLDAQQNAFASVLADARIRAQQLYSDHRMTRQDVSTGQIPEAMRAEFQAFRAEYSRRLVRFGAAPGLVDEFLSRQLEAARINRDINERAGGWIVRLFSSDARQLNSIETRNAQRLEGVQNELIQQIRDAANRGQPGEAAPGQTSGVQGALTAAGSLQAQKYPAAPADAAIPPSNIPGGQASSSTERS